jgi:hypothetical protein
MWHLRPLILLPFALITLSESTKPTGLFLPIPKSFWGLHIHQADSYPVKVPYGQWRGWDAGVQWQLMSSCPGTKAQCQSDPSRSTVDWKRLDGTLVELKQEGVEDVFYTLNRTPEWATPHPDDDKCDYGGGECWPPVDLNLDGSGSDAIWKDWVSRIAKHVNDPRFLKNHAHIKYWEPWNEWFDNSYFGWGPKVGAHLTYAQMLRLTEDLRCVVTGRGTIHNYPRAGDEASCTATAIDADALISTPSDSPDCCLYAMQNFLYCDFDRNNRLNDLGDRTTCTWRDGKNWGSQAIDLINFHFYSHSSGDGPPEAVIEKMQEIRNFLHDADRAKPIINGEGSSGVPNFGRTLWNDDYSRMGLVPRFLALYWSEGITMNFWYAYDISAALWSGNQLTAMGKAWVNTYNWLQGATPATLPFCSNRGTLYTCSMRKANGQPAQLVWDAGYGPGGAKGPADCSTATNPVICGYVSYKVPKLYSHDWLDITGTIHPFQSTVTVGAVPILLEGAPL